MSSKSDTLLTILQALGVAAGITPTIKAIPEAPHSRVLPEGPVVIAQFGSDTYHCSVIVSASAELPDAVLARLFMENFQHGLTRYEGVFRAGKDINIAMELAPMKAAAMFWADSFPTPEGEQAVELPFIVRWEAMGTIETMSATTFISYGKKYTPEEKEKIVRNFNAMHSGDAADDTTPVH